ncbi:unnamed protein product, partial [Brassica oleracea]
ISSVVPTSLCSSVISSLLRHDSGSYSSSTVMLHLFCEPRAPSRMTALVRP